MDSLFGAGPRKTSVEREAYPALALLGDPGIGESPTLKREHERVSALPAERNIASVHVDCEPAPKRDPSADP